jgi:hypothetical protein
MQMRMVQQILPPCVQHGFRLENAICASCSGMVKTT